MAASPSELRRALALSLDGPRFVLRERRDLLKWCLAPLGLAVGLYGAVAGAIALYADDLLAAIWARPAGGVTLGLWYAVYAASLAGLAVAGCAAFVGVYALVASPFHELLSERVEEQVTGRPSPPTSATRLAREALGALAHAAGKLLVQGAALTPLALAALLVPGVGAAALTAGGLLATAFFLAFDLFDPCMTRRRLGFGARLAFLVRHLPATLAFGGVTAVVAAVPLVGLLFLPTAACGATRLFLELEARDRARSRPRSPGGVL